MIIDIALGTVIGMLLGALWYSPIAFGPAWMESLGKTEDTLGSATLPMLGSVLASFLTAVGVSLLSSQLDITTLHQAAILGATLGFLIIFPALLSDNLFCGWGTKLLLIQSGYRLTAVLLISIAIFLV